MPFMLAAQRAARAHVPLLGAAGMTAILVFFAVAALDVVWTLYIKATAEHRALAAAGWSAMIIAVGGFATTEYVKDPWLLIPAAAGAFVGTWCVLRWKEACEPHRGP